MSILINDTQFSLISGQVSGLRNYTGISPTGLGTSGYITRFTNNGSGIENSNIFSSGSFVGIGTGSPQNHLVINGVTQQGGVDIVGTNGGSLKVSQGVAVSAGYIGIEYSNPKLGLTRTASHFLWYDTSNGNVIFNNTFGGSSNLKLQYGGNDVVDVTASRYVGIGATSPISKLDVSGSILTINLTGKNVKLDNFLFSSGIVLSGRAPSAFNSPGFSGQLALSGTNLYICTGINAWGRIPILSF